MFALSEYSLNAVAKVLKTPLMVDDARFSAVSTDTRTLQMGNLFVALRGPNFDGHQHLASAKAKGAVAAIVDHQQDLPIPQFIVKDTKLALGELAKARRQAFNGKVIGLTGSNGKTTVKELIANILRQQGKVLATQGNLNNNIGLPLTLLQLENDEQFAVIEMGANHSGEIAYLTDITRPDVALITNAGAAHLEGFGSIKGVAYAKAEIYSGIAPEGCAIINLDDQYAPFWLEKSQQFKQLGFGLQADKADVSASNIVSKSEMTAFDLQLDQQAVHIRLPLSGLHNVSNALAAAAAVSALGIRLDLIQQGLQSFTGIQGRLKVNHLANEVVLIDDSYNANLDSMKAAIDVLETYPTYRILVVGDLFEVGADVIEIHKALGVYAKAHAVDELLAVGEMSKHVVQAFARGAKHFDDKAALANYLKTKMTSNVAVLVKGSRGMHMEDVINNIS